MFGAIMKVHNCTLQADAKIARNNAKGKFKLNALMSTWPGGRIQRDTLNTNSSLSIAGVHKQQSKEKTKNSCGVWQLYFCLSQSPASSCVTSNDTVLNEKAQHANILTMASSAC